MTTKTKKTWRKVKLGEVLKIRRGASPRPIHEYISTRGMPWLKIADVTSSDSRFVDSTKEFIKKEGISKSVVVKQGDLILSNSATPGIPRFMRIIACVHDGWLILKPINNSINKNFLYYRLIIDRRKLVSSVTGAVFDNLKTDILRDHEIFLPPLFEQKRIADILSAFDDKIELNNKISKNLEQMAKVIFKEWFVNFKFPGHEKVKMVDLELGKIPEGWEMKNIGSMANVVLGGTPSRMKPEYWGGNIPWINSGKVNEFRIMSASEYITKKGLNGSNARLMPKRTTVIAITGATLGQVSLLEIEASANQSVVGIFDSDTLPHEFIYLYVKQRIDDLINAAAGGAQQHINKQVVETYPILVPDKNTITEFTNAVKPIFDQTVNVIFENQKLATLRDLLLPKLMSGEIRV